MLKLQILAMKNKGGVIINVTSVAARKPDAGTSLYNASKGAAAMLTQRAAGEAGSRDPAWPHRPPGGGDAIMFLCSPSASYVTAASLTVGGGFALG